MDIDVLTQLRNLLLLNSSANLSDLHGAVQSGDVTAVGPYRWHAAAAELNLTSLNLTSVNLSTSARTDTDTSQLTHIQTYTNISFCSKF